MTETRLKELNKLAERIDILRTSITAMECNTDFEYFNIQGVRDDKVPDYLFSFDNPQDWKIGQELGDLKDLRDVIINHMKEVLAKLEKEFEEE